MTTPTSRRRDVRASTATAPAADEERGAQFSPALAKKRENGCRLLLLRYTSGRQPPSNYLGRAVFFSRVSPPRGEFSPATPRGNHSHNPLPFSHPPALFLSLLFLRHHLSLAVSPFPSFDVRNLPPLPFTIAATTLPSGFQPSTTPLGPLTLRRAPSRARYQPAAIPTATTESRDRPRVVGSPPVSHPTRRHATPRAACVSLHRVSKACEREKPYRVFLVP